MVKHQRTPSTKSLAQGEVIDSNFVDREIHDNNKIQVCSRHSFGGIIKKTSDIAVVLSKTRVGRRKEK